jgi:hypothetical protein
LNLTRAIGDLEYKGNKNLKPEEQIITAAPEIKKWVINIISHYKKEIIVYFWVAMVFGKNFQMKKFAIIYKEN